MLASIPLNKSDQLQKKELPTIAVTMATSRQGKAVVNYLAKSKKFNVRAITRDPFSKNAQVLAQLPNVEIAKGNLLDKNSLEKHFAGAYGVFGNTSPTKGWVLGRGSMVSSYELEQGKNIVDTIKKVQKSGDLKHFIFSSVCKGKSSFDEVTIPSHFSNKWSLENYILDSGLNEISTVLRPASYFENFNSIIPTIRISESIFPGIVQGNKPWQTIAVDDIGKWAKAAFSNPEIFLGEQLNLASEEMTGIEMAALLEELQEYHSKTVRYKILPRPLLSLLEHDLALMATWIEQVGYGADIKKLKKIANQIQLKMTPLKVWLVSQLDNQSYKKSGPDRRKNYLRLIQAR